MADAYVRPVEQLEDEDGAGFVVGVYYDTVTLGPPGPMPSWGLRLSLAQAEDFARAFTRACWEAGANLRQMRLHFPPADLAGIDEAGANLRQMREDGDG